MSHARTISISDHHRRRKRLLIFNQRHQDKAFHFLKLLVIFLKKTKSVFGREGHIWLEDISKITVSKAILLYSNIENSKENSRFYMNIPF